MAFLLGPRRNAFSSSSPIFPPDGRGPCDQWADSGPRGRTPAVVLPPLGLRGLGLYFHQKDDAPFLGRVPGLRGIEAHPSPAGRAWNFVIAPGPGRIFPGGAPLPWPRHSGFLLSGMAFSPRPLRSQRGPLRGARLQGILVPVLENTKILLFRGHAFLLPMGPVALGKRLYGGTGPGPPAGNHGFFLGIAAAWVFEKTGNALWSWGMVHVAIDSIGLLNIGNTGLFRAPVGGSMAYLFGGEALCILLAFPLAHALRVRQGARST